MDVAPPQQRKCSECQKVFSLNMFRPDKFICRYCESGRNAPIINKELSTAYLSESELESTIEETQPVIAEIKVELDSSSLQSINQVNTIFINNNEDSNEIVSKAIYKEYVYEVNISLGSIIRWSKENDGIEKLANWLLSREYSQRLMINSDSIKVNTVHKELVSLIETTDTNVTIIKACIRTLLKSTQKRRLELINFIESCLAGDETKTNAINILKEDLLRESQELGYPIPVIPINEDRLTLPQINLKGEIQNCSKQTTIINLVKLINSDDKIIERNPFEKDVKYSIIDLLNKKSIHLNPEDLDKYLEEGINHAYRICGISEKNKGLSDPKGISVIDLTHSSTY